MSHSQYILCISKKPKRYTYHKPDVFHRWPFSYALRRVCGFLGGNPEYLIIKNTLIKGKRYLGLDNRSRALAAAVTTAVSVVVRCVEVVVWLMWMVIVAVDAYFSFVFKLSMVEVVVVI